jgi:antitoxin Phd
MLNRISIDEASKNFLKVIETVDENGAVIILKGGIRYIVRKCGENEIGEEDYIDSSAFRGIAENIMNKHIEAFKELAK